MQLAPSTVEQLREATSPILTRWIPHDPTPPQSAFLLLDCKEALYGGAAGGGKSDALLMGALQYVHIPGYSAILLRRTYPQLTMAEGLIPRSHEWLQGTDAQWSTKRNEWTFPSGATVKFGSMQYDDDKYQYQGGAYQYIGFDEATHFLETQVRYMFSRLRRPASGPLASVPLRVRLASNPGGVGHQWVKRRYLDEGLQNGRIFIPARLEDNPHLDQAAYVQSLSELDPVTRMQLLRGDWSARNVGAMFRREWFEVIERSEVPAGMRTIRYWDLAATKPSNANPDPDWTRGALGGKHKGVLYVLDVAGLRDGPHGVKSLVRQRAREDGAATAVHIEQEPGASGKIAIADFREQLFGYELVAVRPTGEKSVRARPLASAAEAGNVKFVRGPWIGDVLDEIEAFPYGGHDDAVDAISGLHAALRGQDAPGWKPDGDGRRGSAWV